MKNKSIKILDCTLRDGGYYNNWDFSNQLANEHLKALSLCSIDIVEIGLRSNINNRYKGPFAFSSDSFLEKLKVPENLLLSVLVNCKELGSTEEVYENLNLLFPGKKINSKIDIVRLATTEKNIKSAIEAGKILKDKGYQVCLNIMQGASLTHKSILEITKSLKNTFFSSIYIADSTGSMDSIEYNNKLKLIIEETSAEIGIHAHNNLGKALDNTLKSIDIGCTWLDATILGMGRGPGNTDLEELIIYLTNKGKLKESNILPLINHSEKWFCKLKEQYKWGTNRFYFLSGLYKIHPSYIQEMISDSKYSNEEIIGAIEYLKTDSQKNFNSNKLTDARGFFKNAPKGKDDPKEFINGKEVLFIGNGPSIKTHKDEIENLIKTKDLYVICTNVSEIIDPILINARIVCHPMRLLADYEILNSLNQKIIAPFSMVPKKLQQKINIDKVYDYGIKISRDTAEFNGLKNYCIIPYPIALAYGLAILSRSSVNEIKIAGFDGYPKGDSRNLENEEIFSTFKKIYNKKQLFSITPSNYNNLESKSIYGNLL